MHYTRSIDWLAITIPKHTRTDGIKPSDPDPEEFLPNAEFRWTGKGQHGYKNRLECSKTGAIAQTGSNNADMGTHVSLSAQALDNVRSVWELSDDEIFRMVRAARARASRVDCAVDIYDTAITPQGLEKSIGKGKAFARAKNLSLVASHNGKTSGSTLYVGSRASDRFFRCYDKRAERGLGEDGETWVRAELELKGVVAHMFGKAAETNSVDALIVGHMSGFLQWPNSDYENALRGEAVAPQPVGRKETDSEKWLIKICAPALAKAVELHPEFMYTFMDEFNHASGAKLCQEESEANAF